MRRYSEYKDSGVEWIGEIPSHWEVKKLKYVMNNFNSKRKPIDADRRSKEGDVLYDYYGASGVIDQIDNYIFDETSLLIGEDGANLVMRNLPLIYIATGKYWVNNHAHILRPKQGNNLDYMAYQMENIDYSEYITGSAQPKLSQENLNKVLLVTPPSLEQKIIADYLGKKTSQIETLISKKEELIETLKTSRTKLISETVTKGLYKDVPMKDSGVEWIGEIPKHYEIKKLKNLCTHIGRGKSPEYEDNTDTYTVNQACLYWNYFKAESIKSVSNKFYNSLNRNQKINKGDILINSTGGGNLGKSAFFDKTGTLGRVHFYEGDEKYAYDSHVTMVRLKENFNKKYFYYMFCTKNVHSYIDLFCVNGSTKQIELSKTGLESILIPVPSKIEQDEISNYLDKKTSQIDTLVATIEEQIQLLKKAKQKLITEVVTGKIDVTNL